MEEGANINYICLSEITLQTASLFTPAKLVKQCLLLSIIKLYLATDIMYAE